MELIFFGTSAGAPTRTRNTSAVAVKMEKGRGWNLVDAGEGTLHRIMSSKLALNGLDAIFITHLHGDHIFGLPGILYQMSQDGRGKAIKVVGPAELKSFIDIAVPRLKYDIDFIAVEDTSLVHESKSFTITRTVLSHRLDCFGYKFTEKKVTRDLIKEKLIEDNIQPEPFWGYIHKEIDFHIVSDRREITASEYLTPEREPRSIFVSGDNDNPGLLAEACKDVNILVHESTYLHEDLNDHRKTFGHSSSKMVAEFAESIKLPHLIMTHFSPKYKLKGKSSVEQMKNEAEQVYNGNVCTANDLDVFRLTPRGYLLLNPG
jgi:ribonuclease Z